MKIVMTTLFGIESIAADELTAMGYVRDQIQITDGQLVLDIPDLAQTREAVARINIGLRTGERVLLMLAQFPATDFDTLFDQTRALPWEDWLDRGAAFHVNGYSRKSALFGIPACQGIIKKAIVDRLTAAYHLAPGSPVPEDVDVGLQKIQFGIVSDRVTMMVDTSGDGLHKRGYRPLRHEAPIKETLAAAMLYLSRFRYDPEEALLDPFCGSGTIPIEAALMASHTAPGLNRSFAAERWNLIGKSVFDRAREEALARLIRTVPAACNLFGSDIDAKAAELSQENARHAGVEGWIKFRHQDVLTSTLAEIRQWTGHTRLLVVCNPPYGARLSEQDEVLLLYQAMADLCLDPFGQAYEDLRLSIITPEERFEQLVGGKADKRRKLYNGMIKCTLYHYFRHHRN